MKRFAAYAGIGAALFAFGFLFAVGLGSYLGRDEAPAVLQPSSFGRAI